MDAIAAAVILGIIEGITEFLPVSSTGHLIIAGHLCGFTGELAKSFEIVIQMGAILAVVVMYWPTLSGLLKSDKANKFSGIYGLWLLFLTSLPASVLGLIAYSFIKEKLFNPGSTALALAVGALAILAVEGRKKSARLDNLNQLNARTALGIGLFQCLSLWPGFSRSAATIIGGIYLGANRKLAAEYSFLAAIPIMLAASGLEMIQNWRNMDGTDLNILGLGFVVSFIVAWFTVKVFIRMLEKTTLRPFAWYRLILAPLTYFLWSL